MLTDLKLLLSLARKHLFYRLEHHTKGEVLGLNMEDLEMHKWNILKDKAQKVDGKNGVICLVIMFTPSVTNIKNVKNGSFFVFFADKVKVWEKYFTTTQKSYCVLVQKMVCLIGFGVVDGRNIRKTAESPKNTERISC